MNKNFLEKIKDNKDKVVSGVFLAIVFILIAFVYGNDFNRNKASQTNTSATTKAVDTAYTPTSEEEALLKKSYNNFEGKDHSVFSDLDKMYTSMSEDKKKNIKTDMERIYKEKAAYEEECKKQSVENKQLYAEFTNEVESSYPSMKVSSISGIDKKKVLTIDMKLLENLDSTYSECAKLTVKKETRMKEIGINKISVMVNNSKGENEGMLLFELQGGRYKPTLNTFKYLD